VKTPKDRSALIPVLLGALLLAGCGSAHIRLQLQRPEDCTRPLNVGIFFLSRESALNGVGPAELINHPERFTEADGVLDRESFPLYPGDSRVVAREKPDTRIGWIVVAGGYPDSPACAIQRVPVKKKSKFALSVSAEETCLKVQERS
jgi:hypothetical protein